ncbi:hypothetical protein Tco_0933741 [Tanacetum coccineum]
MSKRATHNAIMEADGKDRAPMLVAGSYVTYLAVLATDVHLGHLEETKLETYSTVDEDIKKRIDVEAEAAHIILTRIDNNVYSTVDACANVKEMWIVMECLMQGENINK